MCYAGATTRYELDGSDSALWGMELSWSIGGPIGTTTVNVLAIPGPRLAALTRPPWASVRALAMASPIPAPPRSRFRAVSAR